MVEIQQIDEEVWALKSKNNIITLTLDVDVWKIFHRQLVDAKSNFLSAVKRGIELLEALDAD